MRMVSVGTGFAKQSAGGEGPEDWKVAIANPSMKGKNWVVVSIA